MDNKLLINKKGRVSWYSAAVLSILFLNIGIMLPPSVNTANFIIKYSILIILGVMSFFLFYLKKGSKIRWILFSFLALVMSIWFMSGIHSIRGHLGITESDIVQHGIPFCHIAIIDNILSMSIFKVFIHPGVLTGADSAILDMILIWFWGTLLIGKGWCSWGCFYGGWDNFFSSIIKKPLIKIPDNLAKKLRILPYALLISTAIMSLLLFTTVFCTYICPFKTVTEFEQVVNYKAWIAYTTSVIVFFGSCILLPVIFGKRIWCTYLCPFGAFQGLLGKIFGIFRLKIDKDKCIDCKKCVDTCKVSGITEASLQKKKFTSNCSLCGSCIESCPKNAINASVYGIKDSPKKLFDKITRKLTNIKIINNVRNIFSNLLDDIINPQTFLYFFGLTVLVNFLSTFYCGSMNFILKIFGGI